MAADALILGDRYQVHDPLNCGTLADIRLGYDTLLQRKVTIKLGSGRSGTMRGGDHDGQSIRLGFQMMRGWYADGQTFTREAQMAASLQHPHLLPVYDFGIDGDYYYLVTRFFNETLRDQIGRYPREHPMPLDVALPLFQSLAGAIDYLHERGVVHGNLKPNNIVVDTELRSRMHPFISDFGVAALGPALAGTPLYMAPEQATNGVISRSADLFAFGIIAYECLTGAAPFTGRDVQALTISKLQPEDGQYSVRRIRRDVPIGVDVVIGGLTRPDPSERYATASAAIDELARCFYSAQSTVMGTVFLSYAREQGGYVHDLARRLRSVGISVWLDQDIEPGTNWDRSVEEALRRADSMLVIMSPAAVRSETVTDEWSYFVDAGKPVYPAVYEPCELPLRLRRRQYISLNRDMLADVAHIVGALAGSSAPV
jgi:serine/threonine protein kinase